MGSAGRQYLLYEHRHAARLSRGVILRRRRKQTAVLRTGFELRQLYYFVGVAEELNLSRAARRLYVAQPAITRQIQKIEERIGTPLFERSQRGLKLTDAGEKFLLRARATIEEVDRAVRAAHAAAGLGVNKLVIGITALGDLKKIHAAVEAVRNGHPDLEVVTTVDVSPLLVAKLERGELDAALIGTPIQSGGLCLEPVGFVPYMAALHTSDPLARKKSITVSELASRRLVLPSRYTNSVLYEHILQRLRALGWKASTVFEVDSVHGVMLSVKAGTAGLFPSSIASTRPAGVVCIPIERAVHAKLGCGLALAYRPADGDARLQVLLKYLAQALKTVSAP